MFSRKTTRWSNGGGAAAEMERGPAPVRSGHLRCTGCDTVQPSPTVLRTPGRPCFGPASDILDAWEQVGLLRFKNSEPPRSEGCGIRKGCGGKSLRSSPANEHELGVRLVTESRITRWTIRESACIIPIQGQRSSFFERRIALLILSEAKGSATVSVAPVGVSPTESNGHMVNPFVNRFRPARMFGDLKLERRASFRGVMAIGDVPFRFWPL